MQAYGRYGADPAPLLARAQVEMRRLADDNYRLTAAQLELVAASAMRALDDEALGWFSRPLRWGSYGMLARASLTAPDVGVAMRRWFRHHHLLTGDIRLELPAEAGVAEMRLYEDRPIGGHGPDMREFGIVSVLRNALGYACWLADSRIPLMRARLPFPPPPHADIYPVLFGCPVDFGADHAAFAFDARYLALKVRRDEAAIGRMLADAVPLIVHRYRHDRLLVERVRGVLAARAEADDAGAVAEALGLSVRTLHRQLAREGASLQALKDETRLALAQRLLERSERPVKQVAAAVGFANEKSFARAFKGWTGLTPAEFRARSAT
ncbi:MAG: AraC family transcriptional regulator [Zavarzinia sp.]|nr:AraC family transcriptional regulator [Zavarzinia sp.]